MTDIIKQVIVIRKDLMKEKGGPMSAGKLAVQVAHASLGALLLNCDNRGLYKSLDLKEHPYTEQWLDESFRKIVLYVKSEEKLLRVYQEIKDAGYNVSLITDAGYTVFDEPTITCFGVEPLPSSIINKFTRNLQLYE
jgi:peptidyl-tRNA hydrolase